MRVVGTDHQPFALAISSQYVFWADHTHTTLWRLPLNSSDNFPRLQEVMKYHRTPQALVSSQSGEWRSGHCNAIIEPMTTVGSCLTYKSRTALPMKKEKKHQALHKSIDNVWKDKFKIQLVSPSGNFLSTGTTLQHNQA